MQDKLNEFERHKVWTLVPRTSGKTMTGTRWVYRNKVDKDGIITRNKARLVAQGFTQIESIDYGETFAPVAHIEAIILDCKPASTPVSKTDKLHADPTGTDVNHSLYRGMIGSLLYLTVSRPDIMFGTILCAQFQANPKESHLMDVKRIFRYLKGTQNLALWYPRDSAFELFGYTDSDYAGCNLDKKSTLGGCHFLGNCLISWSSKKQTSVAISTAEVEYVAAGRCYAQLLWIQNQLLDYGLKFTKTPIFSDVHFADDDMLMIFCTDYLV
ncbi:hypothetical protein Lser_V15G40850 [Lactuca serriola]